jgi:hypothetical protein
MYMVIIVVQMGMTKTDLVCCTTTKTLSSSITVRRDEVNYYHNFRTIRED